MNVLHYPLRPLGLRGIIGSCFIEAVQSRDYRLQFRIIVTGQNILHVVEYSYVTSYVCVPIVTFSVIGVPIFTALMPRILQRKASHQQDCQTDAKKSLQRCVAGEILYLANKLITSDQASFFRRSRISVRRAISAGVSSSFSSSSCFLLNLSFALFIAWMIRKITNAIMMN